MANNTTLNTGIGGDNIATEDTGLGYKLPVSKLRTGGIDIDGGDVTINNPLPVSSFTDEFGTLSLPTTRLIEGFVTLHVLDDVNREFHERNTVALETLLDIENARSHPLVISSPPIVTDFGMVVRQAGPTTTPADISGVGFLNASGASLVIPLNGVSILILNIVGTWTATITFYYSVDGTNWIAAANPGFVGLTAAAAIAVTTATNGTFTFSVGGCKYFKAAITAYTSGSASITYNSSLGIGPTPVISTNATTFLATVSGGSSPSTANSWAVKITDTTNGPVAVKASGVAPLTTDPALVMTLSPNTYPLVGKTPSTNPVPIGATDITNTMASISAITLNGSVMLQVYDNSLRIILEQMLLLLVDISAILSAANLKGETVSLSNININTN